MNRKITKKSALFLVFLLIFDLGFFTANKNINAKSDQEVFEDTILSNSELAEALTEYEIDANNHIERLYDEESDFNTIIYLNSDGSETAYIFDEEIKYIDDKGIVQDKSNKISTDISETKFLEEYEYVNDRNDVNTYFPEVLEQDTGVILDYNDTTIEMYPNISTDTEATKINDDMIVYDDVFDESIQLQYQPTFSGFKENIVIYDNKINSFSFIVEAENMLLENENGAINFISTENGDVAATMSPIYVYDSLQGDTPEGETHYTYANKLTFKELGHGKYEVIIDVDAEFLNNDTTIYPVYIDPSITIKASGSGKSKTIIDTPIYNGKGVTKVTSGANTTSVLGYVNSSYGAGRLLMQFPGLMKQSFMNSKYTITSANLTLKEVSGQSSTSKITAYNYTGPTWNESSVYSSSIWNGVGSALGSTTFSYPDYTLRSINILSAVKTWQANSSAAAKGIILKNTTSESSTKYYKSICTSENSNKPYIKVNYFYNGTKGIRTVGATQYRNLNCQGYAFFLTGVDLFPQMTKEDVSYCRSTTVDNALLRTKTRMVSWLNSKFGTKKWREVKSYDASLASDEWLVCMRVGVVNGNYDYHYWYRANNGKCYNKHGYYLASECVSGVVNPSTANSSSGWSLGGQTNFYSSKTI